MSGFDKLSIPEKIVWLFEHKVTEAHRHAIEQPLQITAEQFDQAIPHARDLGVERGMRITPIYDTGLEGWWTRSPTQRIAALAEQESVKRQLGEARRNARVFAGFGKVGKAAAYAEVALVGAQATMLAELPIAASSADWVIERVHEAVEAKRGFVAHDGSLFGAA